MLAREGNDRLVGTFAILQVGPEGVEVPDTALDAPGYYHGPRLATNLAEGDDLVVEMIDHNLGLKPYCVIVAFHVVAQLLVGSADVELGVSLDGLD